MKHDKKYLSIYFFQLIFFSTLCASPSLNFRGNSSFLQVSSGATLKFNQAVSQFSGKLIKKSGATVSGSNITFVDGVLQDADNDLQLNGIFNPAGTVSLNGNKTFKAEKGTLVQSLQISGSGNNIEGVPTFSSAITLQDANAAVTIAVQSVFNKNIVLNGGTLTLGDNFSFGDAVVFSGNGDVNVNGYRVNFGGEDVSLTCSINWTDAADISLHSNIDLSGTFTFNGTNRINGNGFIIDLASGGELVVASGATLYVNNATLKNIADAQIRCVDDTGTIILQDVTWLQKNNATFAAGTLQYKDLVVMKGNGAIFAYQSSQPSSILGYSQLYLDNGFTFSYDPVNSASKNLLVFEDATSILSLDGATLHATTTGVQLKKGIVLIESNSNFASEKIGELDEGITLGSGTESEDCVCEILSGVRLTITQGSLHTRNVGSGAWIMHNEQSNIYISSGATLRLYENLDIGNGSLYFDSNATLARITNVSLSGTTHILGALSQILLSE